MKTTLTIAARALAMITAAVLATLDPVLADGLRARPAPAGPPPPQPSQSCLMTALQMGYLTGRREVAYANTEACLMFTRERGVVLPYEWYGPPRYGPPPNGYGPPPNGNGR
jgi:hypothetical protein